MIPQETEQGIFDQVLHGELDFSSDPWPSISDGAKDLVRRMLVRDPRKRLTAHEVLCESFFLLCFVCLFIYSFILLGLLIMKSDNFYVGLAY